MYTPQQINEYKKWQRYHFNMNSKGKDSRKEYSDGRLTAAIREWKKGNKTKALTCLGYGLHAIQDIEAHGQIGKGKDLPQHIVSDIKSKKYKADKINYDWINSKRISLVKSSEKKRLFATRRATYSYLERFIKGIGGKYKLK